MVEQIRPVFITVGANSVRVFALEPAERACRLAEKAGLECAQSVPPGRSAILASLDFAWDPTWLKTVAAKPGSVLMIGDRPVLMHLPVGEARPPAEQAMLGIGGSLEGLER